MIETQTCEELSALFGRAYQGLPDGEKCVVVTDCFYPSFDRVRVHVERRPSGFRVSDGGELAGFIFLSGRDASAAKSGLELAARYHSLEVDGGRLVVEVTADWLSAAVLAVANGAALAAHEAMGVLRSGESDNSFVDAIVEAAARVFPPSRIKRPYKTVGESGREWTVDVGLVGVSAPILIKALKPHPTSISSAFTAFSDVDRKLTRWAVYRDELSTPDVSLMLKVSSLIPLYSITDHLRTRLLN
jgi:hypothetical protein